MFLQYVLHNASEILDIVLISLQLQNDKDLMDRQQKCKTGQLKQMRALKTLRSYDFFNDALDQHWRTIY